MLIQEVYALVAATSNLVPCLAVPDYSVTLEPRQMY